MFRARSSSRNIGFGRRSSLAALLQLTHCTSDCAPGPVISISPMWLTSKSPARVRTASCSARMPEYSSGMSQPPKLTMRAFKRRCTALRAVLRVSAMAGVVTGKIEPWWPNIEISMVILGCQENGPRGIFRIKCSIVPNRYRCAGNRKRVRRLWRTQACPSMGGRRILQVT